MTMNGPRSYTFTDQGGKQSFSFSCNRDWRVSSSDSWIHVSPSSGTASDGEITVTITCDANTTYDPRKTTLTLKVEELTETIEVSQETNHGIIVSPKSYDLSSQAQAVEIEVQANVGYKISIDTSCKDWISEASTKGLTSTKHVFNIAENTTYDNREGKIYVRQEGSDMAETITIKQSQVEAIILNETSYSIECEGGVLKVPVKTNVEITVSIPAEAQSWIKQITTKGLTDQELSFEVEKYEGEDDRSAEITLSGGKASVTITILQKAAVSNEPIPFKDALVKKICVENFDKDGDGEVSYKEATYVTSFDSSLFGVYKELVSSFDEFLFFTGINYFSFSGCTSLSSIILPPNLSNLGLFTECSALKSIIIPEGVKTIGNRAFDNCSSLETVEIKSDLNIIGDRAFWYCTKLRSINIPDTVSEIGSEAFYSCESLESIHIPEGIKELKNGVLALTKKITKIDLPSTLEIIGSEALAVSGITSIDIPNGVLVIDINAFANCRSLQNVSLPESLLNIKTSAFYWCTALKSITIPSSVVSIGNGAFQGSGLESIYIPETVTQIGDSIFDYCSSLQTIQGPFSSEDGRCLVVDGALKGFAFKGLKNYTTPEGIKHIRCCMFGYSLEIQTIVFSEGVETIDVMFYSEKLWNPDGAKLSECFLPASLKEFAGVGPVYHYYILYSKAIEPPTCNDSIFAFSYTGQTIKVPTESVDKYKAASGWSFLAKNIVGYDF